MAMSKFRVRLITSASRNLISSLETMMVKDKWRPCFKEVETYFELDSTHVFVGELDGKPIGCVCLFKYSENFWLAGGYIVENAYRGQRYGSQMSEAAFKHVLPFQNLALYGNSDEMTNKYAKRLGLKSEWTAHTYDLHLPSASRVLSQSPLSSLYSAKTIDEVDPAALYDYDTKVFGYPREAFLQKFLRLPGSHARVAVDGDDNIVGYTAARVAINKDEGYRLGPLFAESSAIAKVLLKALFEEMLEKGRSSSPSVWMESPDGRNAEAKKLMEFLQGKPNSKATLLTRKGISEGNFDSWFAVTSGYLAHG